MSAREPVSLDGLMDIIREHGDGPETERLLATLLADNERLPLPLNEQILNARLKKGLSRAALSIKTGLGRETIRSIEVSRRRPSIEALGRIEEALGVEFDIQGENLVCNGRGKSYQSAELSHQERKTIQETLMNQILQMDDASLLRLRQTMKSYPEVTDERP